MKRHEEALMARARDAGLGVIAEKVLARERLSPEDGVELYRTPHLWVVGELANHVRERRHGDLAYFNVNQHINYTNYCNKFCSFCSFDRQPGQAGAYTFTPEQAAEYDRLLDEWETRRAAERENEGDRN